MTGLSSTLADDAPYRRPRQRGARERELLLVDVQTARSSPNSQAAPRLQGSAISHDSQPTHAPASETPCDWRDCCPLGSAFCRLHPNPGPVHLAAIPTPLQSQSHLRIYFKENSVHASKPFAFFCTALSRVYGRAVLAIMDTLLYVDFCARPRDCRRWIFYARCRTSRYSSALVCSSTDLVAELPRRRPTRPGTAGGRAPSSTPSMICLKKKRWRPLSCTAQSRVACSTLAAS